VQERFIVRATSSCLPPLLLFFPAPACCPCSCLYEAIHERFGYGFRTGMDL
jgi:hypothetical protein